MGTWVISVKKKSKESKNIRYIGAASTRRMRQCPSDQERASCLIKDWDSDLREGRAMAHWRSQKPVDAPPLGLARNLPSGRLGEGVHREVP